jgi:hypothetical protein
MFMVAHVASAPTGWGIGGVPHLFPLLKAHIRRDARKGGVIMRLG